MIDKSKGNTQVRPPLWIFMVPGKFSMPGIRLISQRIPANAINPSPAKNTQRAIIPKSGMMVF